MDKILFLAILSGAMTLFVTQRVPVTITALLTITALVGTGLIPLDAALSGFASPATITIGAMFVLSAGLIKTGALEPLTAKLASWAEGSYFKLILAMALTIPLASAFMNNTPVVVMLVPVVMALGRKFSISPSKMLMPLSFFAILGGTCTLIGTSTNLLIGEIYHARGGTQLGIFDFTPLGLLFLLFGGGFILVFGKRLLPLRDSLSSLLPVGQRSKYVTEVTVHEGSPLVGQKVADIFPGSGSIRFIQLIRREDFFIGNQAKDMVIALDDALILEGGPGDLANLLSTEKVALGTVLEDSARVPMRTFSLSMFELIVLPDSSSIGSRLSELQLYRHFGVKVMAIQRGGRHHRMAIRGMRLKGGDMLLVQGDMNGIAALKDSPEFLVVEDVEEHIQKPHKAGQAISIMAGVVLLATLTPIPLAFWALLGVCLMVLTRCLRSEEAIRALDFNVLFLLIGTIPLGDALIRTGLSEDLAHFLVVVIGQGHPFLMVAGVYLVTNLLTHLLSNTAVAVLMTPLALGLATETGVDPKPLVMAVAFAASTALATPIGYQTNIIVMGPAGYKFGDFVKAGLPLCLLLWAIATVAIPFIWPFH